MSDEYLLEQVEKREAEKLADAIAVIGSKAPQPTRTPDQYLTQWCEDCGNGLPDYRMRCGLVLCTKCQGDKEKLRKLFR